jgi:hypothetical protein
MWSGPIFGIYFIKIILTKIMIKKKNSANENSIKVKYGHSTLPNVSFNIAFMAWPAAAMNA